MKEKWKIVTKKIVLYFFIWRFEKRCRALRQISSERNDLKYQLVGLVAKTFQRRDTGILIIGGYCP